MHFIFIIVVVRIKSMYKKRAVIGGGCEIETSNLFDVSAGGVVRAPFSLAIRDTELVAGEKHRGKQTSCVRVYIYMCFSIYVCMGRYVRRGWFSSLDQIIAEGRSEQYKTSTMSSYY